MSRLGVQKGSHCSLISFAKKAATWTDPLRKRLQLRITSVLQHEKDLAHALRLFSLSLCCTSATSVEAQLVISAQQLGEAWWVAGPAICYISLPRGVACANRRVTWCAACRCRRRARLHRMLSSGRCKAALVHFLEDGAEPLSRSGFLVRTAVLIYVAIDEAASSRRCHCCHAVHKCGWRPEGFMQSKEGSASRN